MARSRSRTRGPQKDVAQPMVILDSASEADEFREHVRELTLKGSRPKASWSRMLSEGKRFTKWLAEYGLTVDDIRRAAPVDPQGDPVLHPVLVVAYLRCCATPDIKPTTLKGQASQLLGWFKGNGWVVPDRVGSSREGETLSIIGALVSHHRYDDVDAFVRVPARPATVEWVGAITREIDKAFHDERLAPLWVDAIRTFHLVTAWFGFRSGEAVTKVRWGWLEDCGVHFDARVPGGETLKKLKKPRTVRAPSPDTGQDCDHPDICVVHQLRRWRDRCAAAGIPTGPDDLLFPAVRRMPSAHQPITSQTQLRWGDRLWVADPIAERMAAARAAGCDDDELEVAKESAGSSHYNRYAPYWKEFAVAAGFEPRHRFEAISTYSNRRGCATRLSRNGASLLQVAHHLCQESLSVTSLYIDRDDEALDPRPLYNLDLDVEIGLPDDSSLHLPELITSDTEFRPPTGCDLVHEGAACDLPFAGFIEVDGVGRAVCAGHRWRFRTGKRGADLMKPMRRPLDPQCAVAPPGQTCGRASSTTIDLEGDYVSACGSHHRRYLAGKRGWDLIKPLRERLGASCEITHKGKPCGRKPNQRVVVDDEELATCRAHAERALKGIRGAELTKPIDAPRRLAPNCEVAHEGEACGREILDSRGYHIEVDGSTVSACNGHGIRYKAGKRGHALTEPLRVAASGDHAAP